MAIFIRLTVTPRKSILIWSGLSWRTMPLFSAKLDYALRAAVDLAMQPPDEACQSREIAARQNIRGPYLDQILAVLTREGIVRSIRGASGGYTLARSPHRITVGEIVRATIGDQL